MKTKTLNMQIYSSYFAVSLLLIEVRNFLNQFFDSMSFSKCELILKELVTNAIKHGSECNEYQSVDIALSVFDQKVKITVKDNGAGFNHKKLMEELKSNSRNKNGLNLVRNLSDKVFFNDKGNEISSVINIDTSKKTGFNKKAILN